MRRIAVCKSLACIDKHSSSVSALFWVRPSRSTRPQTDISIFLAYPHRAPRNNRVVSHARSCMRETLCVTKAIRASHSENIYSNLMNDSSISRSICTLRSSWIMHSLLFKNTSKTSRSSIVTAWSIKLSNSADESKRDILCLIDTLWSSTMD